MSRTWLYDIGTKVKIRTCDYTVKERIAGYEGVILEHKDDDEYQYKVDLLGKRDRLNFRDALLAESEIELIEDKKEEVKVEKVKLPKKIAKPLGDMLANGYQPFAIVRNHIENCHIKVDGWENLQYVNPDDLIRALYNGYEVEQTPEEQIKAYYDEQVKKFHEGNGLEDWTGHVIVRVLDLLNVKIEGVNC